MRAAAAHRTSSLSFFVAPAATLSNPYDTADRSRSETVESWSPREKDRYSSRGRGLDACARGLAGVLRYDQSWPAVPEAKDFREGGRAAFSAGPLSLYLHLSVPSSPLLGADLRRDWSGRARMTLHRHRVHFRGRLHHHQRRSRHRSPCDREVPNHPWLTIVADPRSLVVACYFARTSRSRTEDRRNERDIWLTTGRSTRPRPRPRSTTTERRHRCDVREPPAKCSSFKLPSTRLTKRSKNGTGSERCWPAA